MQSITINNHWNLTCRSVLLKNKINITEYDNNILVSINQQNTLKYHKAILQYIEVAKNHYLDIKTKYNKKLKLSSQNIIDIYHEHLSSSKELCNGLIDLLQFIYSICETYCFKYDKFIDHRKVTNRKNDAIDLNIVLTIFTDFIQQESVIDNYFNKNKFIDYFMKQRSKAKIIRDFYKSKRVSLSTKSFVNCTITNLLQSMLNDKNIYFFNKSMTVNEIRAQYLEVSKFNSIDYNFLYSNSDKKNIDFVNDNNFDSLNNLYKKIINKLDLKYNSIKYVFPNSNIKELLPHIELNLFGVNPFNSIYTKKSKHKYVTNSDLSKFYHTYNYQHSFHYPLIKCLSEEMLVQIINGNNDNIFTNSTRNFLKENLNKFINHLDTDYSTLKTSTIRKKKEVCYDMQLLLFANYLNLLNCSLVYCDGEDQIDVLEIFTNNDVNDDIFNKCKQILFSLKNIFDVLSESTDVLYTTNNLKCLKNKSKTNLTYIISLANKESNSSDIALKHCLYKIILSKGIFIDINHDINLSIINYYLQLSINTELEKLQKIIEINEIYKLFNYLYKTLISVQEEFEINSEQIKSISKKNYHTVATLIHLNRSANNNYESHIFIKLLHVLYKYLIIEESKKSFTNLSAFYRAYEYISINIINCHAKTPLDEQIDNHLILANVINEDKFFQLLSESCLKGLKEHLKYSGGIKIYQIHQQLMQQLKHIFSLLNNKNELRKIYDINFDNSLHNTIAQKLFHTLSHKYTTLEDVCYKYTKLTIDGAGKDHYKDNLVSNFSIKFPKYQTKFQSVGYSQLLVFTKSRSKLLYVRSHNPYHVNKLENKFTTKTQKD